MRLRIAVSLLLTASACLAAFRAGAAKRTITPDLTKGPVYIAGYDQNRIATRVHDPLYARCLALEAGRAVVVCGVDLIGLFAEDVQKIRDSVNDKLPAPVDVIVAALHDHEGPDTMGLWGPAPGKTGINENYNLLVVERVAETAVAAVRTLRPASLELAEVRDAELDSFINDTRPPVVHDANLVILSAVGVDGKRIATLVNWANHPEALGSSNTEITADYPGYFYTVLEKRAGGIAMLVNGAVGGMQSPGGAKVMDPATRKIAPEDSFRKAELIGTRVAELAANALSKPRREQPDRVEYVEAAIELPASNAQFIAASKAGVFGARRPIHTDGTLTTSIGVLRVSNAGAPLVEAAVVPGEMYPELSVGGVERYAGADFPDAPIEPSLKQMMAAPFRMLFGLGNDEIGYIIPKAEWDQKSPWLQDAAREWYGEVNSVGPETAPHVLKGFAALFRYRGK